jgi:hypothetical protein
MQQAELYRNRMIRAYEKRVQPSIFVCEFLDPGNLVLRVTDKVRADMPDTKFAPNYDSTPYIVTKAYESGYYRLATMDGECITDFKHGKWLRPFYC